MSLTTARQGKKDSVMVIFKDSNLVSLKLTLYFSYG